MRRKFLITAVFIFSIYSSRSEACATSIKGHKNQGSWKTYFAEHKKVDKVNRRPADAGRLPFAKLEPWGGSDSTKWRPEAILANAVSEALNDGYSEPKVKDVLVSLPVKMRYSGNDARVYGDGQTNSAVDLGDGWSKTEPVFIATLIRYENGTQKIKLRFHHTLALTGKSATIFYNNKSAQLAPASPSPDGHSEITWQPTLSESPKWGDLFTNRVAFIQLAGWKDWFPIDFRDVVRPATEMLEQIPSDKRKLGKSDLLDPEMVSVQGKAGENFPFLAMESDSFGKELRAERYFPVPATGNPQGIHNTFRNDRVTSVGRGFSTVYQVPPKSDAPFKMAYICFDRRNREAEAAYGVPSGGGWHEIGDEAETVFNTLEKGPVLFGYANGMPEAKPPSGGFAYGLSDIAVVRKLMPGFAIISAAGKTSYGEDTKDGICLNAPERGKGGPQGRNYHWFAFDQAHEVCALEWVHPNIPSDTNKLGFQPMARTGCK